MPETSSKFLSLDRTDLTKIGKSLLLTVLSMAITGVALWVNSLTVQVDFGSLTPFIATATPFLVNFLRKLASTAKPLPTVTYEMIAGRPGWVAVKEDDLKKAMVI